MPRTSKVSKPESKEDTTPIALVIYAFYILPSIVGLIIIAIITIEGFPAKLSTEVIVEKKMIASVGGGTSGMTVNGMMLFSKGPSSVEYVIWTHVEGKKMQVAVKKEKYDNINEGQTMLLRYTKNVCGLMRVTSLEFLP